MNALDYMDLLQRAADGGDEDAAKELRRVKAQLPKGRPTPPRSNDRRTLR